MSARVVGLALVAALAACRSVLPGPSLPGEPGAYTLEFRGNASLTRDELVLLIGDNLRDFAASGYEKPAIDDAAWVIETRYRRRGHRAALVDFEYERDARGVRVEFLVREGPRTLLEHVRFAKNKEVQSDVLGRFYDWDDGGLLRKGERYFVDEEIASATSRMVAWYRSAGFLFATARAGAPEYVERSRTAANLTVEVDEGVQFHLRSVRLEGELLLPAERVEAVFDELVEKPFVPRVPFEIAARIEELYADEGRPDAVATFELERNDVTGDVALTLTLVPGPEVCVTDVRFSGNTSTRESFLRSRMALAAGERFSRSAVRQSFRRLYRTGLFGTVKIELEPDRAGGARRALLVEVTELPTLELFVEPGLGAYEGPRVKAGIIDRNVLGTGRIARVEASVSPLATRGLVGLTEPALFGSEVSADLTLTAAEREEPSFRFNEVGVGLALRRAWTEAFATSIGYRFRRTDVLEADFDDNPDIDPDDVDETLADLLEDVDIGSITLTPELDTRDDPFLARKGFRTELALEYAGAVLGSELEFFRTRFRTAHYLPLGELASLAASLRTGVIVPLGTSDSIPVQERFFNGGESSVRSFEESDLGPKDQNEDALGGEASTVLSVELRRDLPRGFQVALFYDLGNVVADHNDFLELDDFGQGIGIGLRYALPIGPLRLDAAVNPSPKDDEDELVVHFSIGVPY